MNRQQGIVAIADKAARRSQRVVANGLVGRRNADAARASQPRDVRCGIMKQTTQGFGAAGDQEGVRVALSRRALDLGLWARGITPKRANARGSTLRNAALIGRKGK